MSNKIPRYACIALLGLWISACFLSACSEPKKATRLAKSAASLPKELIFYNWPEMIPQSVLDAYQEETGVIVTVKTFHSQNEAVANIKEGKRFDVAVIENEFMPGLREGEYLSPLDYQNIPNFKNISAGFMDMSFDPQNRYSVPYTWGVGGLAVRGDLVTGRFSHWNDLWREDLPGKIILSREPHVVVGIALKSLGYSFNSENPKELDAAEALLKKVSSKILFFESEANGAALLAEGENAAAVGYASLILRAQEKNPDIKFVLPEDGLFLWGDNLVVPANSLRKEDAENFINFLLRPEIRAEIANSNYYATPNEAASKWIKPEIINNPISRPPQKALNKSEFILPLSPDAEKRIMEIFTQINPPQ